MNGTTITVEDITGRQKHALEKLHKTCIYGSTVEDVAKHLIVV